jgi:hypothetical protein
MESKLKDQISYTLGGVLLLVFWPAIPLTALVSAWRKIPKRPEAVLKGGATVNTEWSKLYQTMSEQLKSALVRVDTLEKECNDTREQLTCAIKKLNQEYIDCENHRAMAASEIAELKRQNGRLIKRIEELEAEVATLKK